MARASGARPGQPRQHLAYPGYGSEEWVRVPPALIVPPLPTKYRGEYANAGLALRPVPVGYAQVTVTIDGVSHASPPTGRRRRHRAAGAGTRLAADHDESRAEPVETRVFIVGADVRLSSPDVDDTVMVTASPPVRGGVELAQPTSTRQPVPAWPCCSNVRATTPLARHLPLHRRVERRADAKAPAGTLLPGALLLTDWGPRTTAGSERQSNKREPATAQPPT